MDFQRKPLVLIVLDGCGHSDDKQYNAVANAATPLWEELWKSNHPGTFIETSGLAVGLPEGQMGNTGQMPACPRGKWEIQKWAI